MKYSILSSFLPVELFVVEAVPNDHNVARASDRIRAIHVSGELHRTKKQWVLLTTTGGVPYAHLNLASNFGGYLTFAKPCNMLAVLTCPNLRAL